MKRLIAVTLAVSLILSLAACDASGLEVPVAVGTTASAESAESTEESHDTKESTISFDEKAETESESAEEDRDTKESTPTADEKAETNSEPAE